MGSIEELRAAASKAAAAHDADIFLFSGGVEDETFGKVAEIVTRGSTERDRCILIIATNGGSANAAYQIARFFQRVYAEFLVYCPGICKSAGTLIAIGAHGLIMDHFSELGPLDVQMSKEDELGARKSGLLASSTFEALAEQTFALYEHLMASIKYKSAGQISFKLASELAAEMASRNVGQIYSQINPDVIGTERRNLEIAKQYGNRLAAVSKNTKTHTVNHLVGCYPSHDFIIDDDEARKWFQRVELPSAELYELVAAIGEPAYSELDDALVIPLSALAQEGEDNGNPESDTITEDDGGAETLDEARSGDRAGDPGEAGLGTGSRKSVRPITMRPRAVQNDH